jgi:branched-chain amino acid transport system substrate-binding protein
MKQMSNAIYIISVIALLAMLPACQEQTVKKVESRLFTIGAIEPLTGEGAVYGLPVQRVVDQAVADLNEKWKAEGKKVRMKVLHEDGKCSGKDALTAAQNLVNLHDVKVIYGGTCSSETLGFAPFAEENSVLVFSPLSSSPEITTAGDFVFRNYPSDTAQSAAMVPFIAEKGHKKVAILSENTDYAQALRKSYLNLLPEAGVEVVADEVAAPNTKDVRTEVAKIKAAEPDAVILIPQTIPTGGIFAKQVFEANLDAQGFGNDVLGLEESLKEYADELEGYYTPASVFEREGSEEFARLKNLTQCELGFYCATTYDGVFLLGELLERCGEDTACLRDALYATKDWDGALSGLTTFDENGDVGGAFQVNQVTDGKLVKVT